MSDYHKELQEIAGHLDDPQWTDDKLVKEFMIAYIQAGNITTTLGVLNAAVGAKNVYIEWLDKWAAEKPEEK